MVLEGGAEMLESTIFVHDSTAEEMDAYSVTTQEDPEEAAETATTAETVGAEVVSWIITEDWVVARRLAVTNVELVLRGVLVGATTTGSVLVITETLVGTTPDYSSLDRRKECIIDKNLIPYHRHQSQHQPLPRPCQGNCMHLTSGESCSHKPMQSWVDQ